MATDSAIGKALTELRERRKQLDHAITALEALDDVPGLNGTTEAHLGAMPATRESLSRRTRGAGGGAAGAERVLRAHPGIGLTPAELAEGMLANGWESPEHPVPAARAAGNRLKDTKPEEFFFENSRFVFRPLEADGESGVQTQPAPQESPPGR